MKNRLTYYEPNGDWGVVGMNKSNQDEKMYAVACKLRDYENKGLSPSEVDQMLGTVRIGTVIQGYKVTGIWNGFCIAESQTAPSPYVVWQICGENCVENGRYFVSGSRARAAFSELAMEVQMRNDEPWRKAYGRKK